MESDLVRRQNEFARHVAKLIEYIVSKGFEISLGEAYRTPEQQEIYLRTGRSKTRNSYHLKRLAIDFIFRKNGKIVEDKASLQEIGDWWERLHPENSWGGNWKPDTLGDVYHFERRTQKRG